MAAESKHWASIYEWLLKVINSCETLPQITSTRILITRFRTYNIPCDIETHLINKLIDTRRVKFNLIVEKQILNPNKDV